MGNGKAGPERLDTQFVRGVPLPEKSSATYWDGSTTGFGLRVRAGGAKAFFLNYRSAAASVVSRSASIRAGPSPRPASAPRSSASTSIAVSILRARNVSGERPRPSPT